MFAFPTPIAEQLAILSVAAISAVAVFSAITALELYQLEHASFWGAAAHVVRRLSHNPLILAIGLGILFSLIKIPLPNVFSTVLHMLGRTTATVAIFMLGSFLYGRRYLNLGQAFALSSLRMLFLPAVAFLAVNFAGLPKMEAVILSLMHGMPVAVSMLVLSERYNFHKETIASLILISSLGSIVYLPVWLWVLGIR
jgi:predicted permease